ncbi:hypothetical protein Tco_0576652 [Tanacetum coccineum]
MLAITNLLGLVRVWLRNFDIKKPVPEYVFLKDEHSSMVVCLVNNTSRPRSSVFNALIAAGSIKPRSSWQLTSDLNHSENSDFMGITSNEAV